MGRTNNIGIKNHRGRRTNRLHSRLDTPGVPTDVRSIIAELDEGKRPDTKKNLNKQKSLQQLLPDLIVNRERFMRGAQNHGSLLKIGNLDNIKQRLAKKHTPERVFRKSLLCAPDLNLAKQSYTNKLGLNRQAPRAGRRNLISRNSDLNMSNSVSKTEEDDFSDFFSVYDESARDLDFDDYCDNEDEQEKKDREDKEPSTVVTEKKMSIFRSSIFVSADTIPPGASLKANPFGSLKARFDSIYVLGDVINEGAFGTIHKAHHISMGPGNEVAVKVVARTDDIAVDEEITNESEILRDVRDFPNIVRIFDFYMDEDNFYVVQELAAGGDVFDRLVQRKYYTESDARTLTEILFTTIKNLHDQKIIHRDLKPENLLLKTTKNDTDILLCDFGFAKYLPEDGTGLRTHCGTPAFIAPEIINGTTYWAEVDMWSLGVVLFMLLCGYRPFEGDDYEMYNYIVTADYGFDDDIWKTISEEAKNLISNLLILHKEKRFTAKEALDSNWFKSCGRDNLKTRDLKPSLIKMKNYVENIRPPQSFYIDENYTGDNDFRYTVMQPGESLDFDPIGCRTKPFQEVYELGDMVKTGSFGVKYKANHVSTKQGTQVLVDIIDRDSDNEEAFICDISIRKEICEEVPNVLRICDFFIEENKFYVVNELLPGLDLFDHLTEPKKIYTEYDARELAKNLFTTVQHIHERKLVHRNLKPENLRLRSMESDTDIVLGGFSWSKYLPSDSEKGLWTSCGSPAYVAPEVLLGEEYWEEVDIWSVGCTLFLILCGDQAFEVDDPSLTMQYTISADYSFNDPTWEIISQEAKDFISNLLKLDRKERLTASEALQSDWLTSSKAQRSSLTRSEKVAQPGESLKVDPLGSLDVPFENVYELGDVLMKGLFSTIHIGNSIEKPKDKVTVKVIDRKGEHGEDSIREAAVLKGLRDIPHIVTIMDFYMDKEKMYIVLESFKANVMDILSKKKLYNEQDARNLARNLLTVAQQIHTKKLIHRNLKPEVLLLKNTESYSDILLSCFNNSKFLPHGDQTGQGLTTSCGTPAYVAPEILEKQEYWEEVDMWSIGCILFYLLGGYQPFEVVDTQSLYEYVTTADYDFDEPTFDVVSKEAKNMISNLLVVDRKKRFTATQALECDWFSTKSMNRTVSHVPTEGESLLKDQLGGMNVPFEQVYKLGPFTAPGNFGAIHKAHHMKSTNEVTVKIIDRESESGERGIRQAAILKSLRDVPSVITLKDFYMDSEKLYLVFEDTAGYCVFDRLLQKKTYKESEARDLCKILLKATKCIHEQKLVHRNLKPENLYIKSTKDDSGILVGGFSLSKYLEPGCGLWTFCGTPQFTAPEIVAGHLYWEEVDMWSIGCILFTILSGTRPFEGEDDYDTYELISNVDYGFDEPTWDIVSKEAKNLISSLLLEDRKNRLTAKQALKCDWFLSSHTKKKEKGGKKWVKKKN